MNKHPLHSFFDAIFCINLPRRTDRRQHAEAEFAKIGIQPIFVNGVDGSAIDDRLVISSDGTPVSKGDIGCVLSHIKVLRGANNLELNNYLVFEDDCVFKENFNEVIHGCLQQVPGDWDLLYLGTSFNGDKINVNPGVVTGHRMFTTHAMGVSCSIYDKLYERWKLLDEKVDLAVAELQPYIGTYAFDPILVGQAPGFSDIQNKDVNYQHLSV